MRYELTDFEWAAIKPMLPNKPAAFRDVPLAAAMVRCIREDLAAGRWRASVDRKAAPVGGRRAGPRTDICRRNTFQHPAFCAS